MVELQWVRYKGDKGTRYLLALHLGVQDGMHIVLECQKVSGMDVDVLRALQPQMNKLSLGERVEMIQKLCPMAMRQAYRRISDSRYDVISKY